MIYGLCDVIDECSKQTCGWEDENGDLWANEVDIKTGVVYAYCVGPFVGSVEFKFLKEAELPNG